MKGEEVRRCPRSYLNETQVVGGLRGIIPVRPCRATRIVLFGGQVRGDNGRPGLTCGDVPGLLNA